MILKSTLTALFLCTLLVNSEAFAANDEDKSLDAGTFSFQLENDLFSGTDQHYTNGTRISWLSPGGKTYESLELARNFLESIALDDNDNNKDKAVRLGFSFGQDIYTPQDRYTTTLITDDRPYAAWLYGAVSLHTISKPNSWNKSLESVELALGVVGPAALGEETQDFVHEFQFIDTFEGWDNQIHNELGIALLYERKWRLGEPTDLGVLGEFDAIPHVGLSLGNISTQVGVGGAMRWGWNLPNNFGPPSLIQGGAPFLDWGSSSDTPYGAYLFATAEGNYVARNIFIDGNTFRDSHSMNRKPIVGDFSVGAAFLAGPVNIAYSTALKTKEFEGQDKNSRYGSLTISMQNPF